MGSTNLQARHGEDVYPLGRFILDRARALAISRTSANGTTTFWVARFAALEGRNGWFNAALSQITAKVSTIVGFVSD